MVFHSRRLVDTLYLIWWDGLNESHSQKQLSYPRAINMHELMKHDCLWQKFKKYSYVILKFSKPRITSLVGLTKLNTTVQFDGHWLNGSRLQCIVNVVLSFDANSWMCGFLNPSNYSGKRLSWCTTLPYIRCSDFIHFDVDCGQSQKSLPFWRIFNIWGVAAQHQVKIPHVTVVYSYPLWVAIS